MTPKQKVKKLFTQEEPALLMQTSGSSGAGIENQASSSRKSVPDGSHVSSSMNAMKSTITDNDAQLIAINNSFHQCTIHQIPKM
eukprot:jgi/Psemu1/42224/gm1.42224_g